MSVTKTNRLLVGLLISASGAVASAQTTENLEAYVGRYSGFAGSPNQIEVTLESGALHFQPTGQGRIAATAGPNGTFKLNGVPIEVVFHRNDAGAVEAFTYTQGGRPTRLTRVEVLDAQYAAVATAGSAARSLRRDPQGRSCGGEGPDRKRHRRRGARHAP